MYKKKNNAAKKPVQVNGIRVGTLRGSEFEIEVNGDVGTSICLDTEVLESASSLGAVTVSVVSSLKRKRYTANINDILAQGLLLGSQVYCPLDAFNVSVAERR